MRFMEIYNLPTSYDEKLGKFEEDFGIREVYVNPDYIVAVRDNEVFNHKTKVKPILSGLDKNIVFSEITIFNNTRNEMITVIGSLEELAGKISRAMR